MKNRSRLVRVALLVSAHIFIVGLSVSCDGGKYYDLEFGPFKMLVPTGRGVYEDVVEVEVETYDEADYGVIEGRMKAEGCFVNLKVCDDGHCDKLFYKHINPGEAVWFDKFSDENEVFKDFLDKFGHCYDGPFGCYRDNCAEEHDMQFVLEAPCPASANVFMGVDLYEDDNY